MNTPRMPNKLIPSDIVGHSTVIQDEERDMVQRARKFFSSLCKRADSILPNQEERLFYYERAKAYIKDFPNLNFSSDFDDLHSMIMEYVIQNRLIVTGNIGEDYNDSIKRGNQSKESLASRRVDRKKMPEKQEDFAKIVEELFSFDKKSIETIDGDMKIEEEKFLEEKKARDTGLGLTENG